MNEGMSFLSNLALMGGSMKSEKSDRKTAIQKIIMMAVSSVDSIDEAKSILTSIEEVCANMHKVVDTMIWSK